MMHRLIWTLPILLLAGNLFITPVSFGACGDACTTAGDCSGSCPLCLGYCTSCDVLGNEGLCNDDTGGASSACAWSGNSCDNYSAPTLGTGTGGFGTTGYTVQNFGKSSEARAGAYYSNGRLVLTGHYFNGSNNDFATIRLFADGTLDTTWGSGGQVITDLNGRDDRSHGVAIDSLGRVVIVGTTQTSNNGNAFDFGVVRFNSRGQLDTKFNTTGKVTTNFGSNSADFPRSVAIDSLNRVVVGGFRDNASDGQDYAFAVARYDTNGVLDTKFASAGRAITDVTPAQHDTLESVALLSDNRILAFGRTKSGSATDFAVVRYGTNGILDTTYGTGGKVTTNFAGREDMAWAGAWDGEDRFTVAGRVHSGSNYDVGIARYNSDGSLDSNWGASGKMTQAISTTGNDVPRGMTIFGSNDILVTGRVHNGSNWDLFAMRLLSDGALDTRYDTDGMYTADLRGRDEEINSMVWDGAYYFTAIGGSHNGSNLDFAVARISGNAGLAKCGDRNSYIWGSDSTATGTLSWDFSSGIESLYGIGFLSDNSMFLVGSYAYRTAIAGLTPQGTLNTNFGSAGVGVDDNGSGLTIEVHTGIQPNKDGQFMLVGASDQASAGVLYEYGPNGQKIWGNYVGDSLYTSTDFFLSDLNQTFVIGTNQSNRLSLYRMNSDSSMDTDFGSAGSITLATTNLRVGNQLYGITFSSKTGLTACGGHSCGGFLARVSTTGALDSAFGTNGLLTYASAQAFSQCKTDSKNRLVVLGQSSNRCAAWRYKGDSLDTNFDTDGLATIDWASGEDVCSGGVMQNGKIMVGGTSDDTNTFRYSRLLSNGALDAPFHSNPASDDDTFAGSAEKMNRVIISDRDMLYIVGEHFVSNSNWALQAIFP